MRNMLCKNSMGYGCEAGDSNAKCIGLTFLQCFMSRVNAPFFV